MRQRSADKFVPRRCFMAWNSTHKSVVMKFTWGAPVVEPSTRVFKWKHLKFGKTLQGVMKALQVRMAVSGAPAFMVCSIRQGSVRGWLNRVRSRKGLSPISHRESELVTTQLRAELDRWADHLEQYVNMDAIYSIFEGQ